MARRSNPMGFAEPKTPYGVPRSGGFDAKDVSRGKRRLPAPEILPDGTVRYFLVSGPKGRVLLPAEMREALGLEEGDVITAWLKDGEVRMHSHLHGLRKVVLDHVELTAQGGTFASDELIAERRAEAAKDAQEENGSRLREHRKKRK
jgi:bifunctional DNA-binding transcriptional regulator/antitoxin component of YhaV-PrlF toxin-antitoxin module